MKVMKLIYLIFIFLKLSKSKNFFNEINDICINSSPFSRPSFPSPYHFFFPLSLNIFNETTLNIPIVTIFVNAYYHSSLENKFRIMLNSLLSSSSSHINLYLISDDDSFNIAQKILQESPFSFKCNLIRKDIKKIIERTKKEIEVLKKYFSGIDNNSNDTYYGQDLFFISIYLYKFLNLDEIIILDCDLKVNSDIKKLFNFFKHFKSDQVIGIAYENQPVYRHILWKYREENKKTKLGNPRNLGNPGFNSGVMLMNLKKMRKKEMVKEDEKKKDKIKTKYYQYVENIFYFSNKNNINKTFNTNDTFDKFWLQKAVDKYYFKGHLGDQDLFTLMSFVAYHLFFLLPCQWNRQLCVWWKDKGLDLDLFDLYFRCDGKIHIYHGNCNSPIP